MVGNTPATRDELARVLRQLRRRQGRGQRDKPLTYREIAAKAGWSLGIVSDYFSGKVLPPTDRLDMLVGMLGTTVAEQRAVAMFRDRVEESERRARPAAGTRRRPVPHQLPVRPGPLAGRTAALDTMTASLDRLDAVETGAAAVTLWTVGGPPGIGKTTLALHWAHQVADRFPDGQLYVNLRGFGPDRQPVQVADALHGLLETLEVPPNAMPLGVDARAALYRTLLADRRVLVVLDNARDAEQVRPLLPAGPGCVTVVTSRNDLVGLASAEGANRLALGPLPPAESRDLLTRRLGPVRVDAEPDAVRDILDRCGGLPLALAVVAARMAAHQDFTASAVAAELHPAGDRLDALSTSDDPATDVRTVFSWSYQHLDAAAARVFRLLSLHPGPDVSVPAAASLTALPVREARSVLTRLTHAHLLNEHLPGRYGCHDLLRAHAAELCTAVDPPQQRHEARRRLFEHLLGSTSLAHQLLIPHARTDEIGEPGPDVVTVTLADQAQALTWFAAEQEVLRAAVETAAANGFDEHAYRLAARLASFLSRQGRWREQIGTQTTAVDAARRAGSLAGQADAWFHLGLAQARLGHDEQALASLRHAVDASAGDDFRLGQAECALAIADECQRRYGRALDHITRALELCRAAGDPRGEAHALVLTGWYQAHLGDYEPAIVNSRASLVLYEQLGDLCGRADSLHAIGFIHQQLGRPEALSHFHEALALFREYGDCMMEADSLAQLGTLYDAKGDPELAREYWRDALCIYDRLHHPLADVVRADLVGHDARPGH